MYYLLEELANPEDTGPQKQYPKTQSAKYRLWEIPQGN